MKYYIYFSDATLDILCAQILKRIKDRLSAELKLDLKVVALTLKEQPSDETRFARLQLVTEYIDRHLEVGTVDEPGTYFRGNLAMRWGPLGGYFGPTGCEGVTQQRM